MDQIDKKKQNNNDYSFCFYFHAAVDKRIEREKQMKHV